MIQKLLKLLDKISPAEVVYAHCDVPCGLYDTAAMIMAAETINKMVEKIQALPRPAENSPAAEWIAYENSLTRMVLEKEEQGEICKKELLILWTDYFKPEHLEIFPNLHEIFWKAAKLCSKNKQSVDKKAAEELKMATEEIGRIFKKLKNNA